MFDMLDKKLSEHMSVVSEIMKSDDVKSAIYSAADAAADTVKSGGKLLLFGNGGSAADCQHIAAEFVGRFKKERNGYPAIALTVDTSILTSVANDYSFDTVYSRQIEALGRKGDAAVGISTSGNSKNVIAGLKTAKEKGLLTVLFCGEKYDPESADIIVAIPSDKTETVQECHIIAGHFIAGYAENRLEGC